MLSYAAVASDPTASQEKLRLVCAVSQRTGDLTALAALAARPGLPADVLAAVTAQTAAVVVKARLTRPDVTEAELSKAVKDKRVGVRTAVASAAGLPPETYAALLAPADPGQKVLLALALNEDAPTECRYKAIAALSASCSVSDSLSYESRTSLKGAVITIMADDANGFVSHLDGTKLAAFLTDVVVSPRVDVAEASRILAGMLSTISSCIDYWNTRAASHTRRAYYDPGLARAAYLLKSAAQMCAYADIAQDSKDKLVRLAAELQACGVSGNLVGTVQAEIAKGRSRAPKRNQSVVDAINSSGYPIVRLALLGSLAEDLTDEEFEEVVRSSTATTFLSQGQGNPEGLEDLLASVSSPARLAALLSRYSVPAPMLRAAFARFSQSDQQAVLSRLSEYGRLVVDAKYNGVVPAQAWQLREITACSVHPFHALGGDSVGMMQLSVLRPVLQVGARGDFLCCPHTYAELSSQVFDFLSASAPTADSWMMATSMLATLDCSLAELAAAVAEIQG